jgi:hypothetical protein
MRKSISVRISGIVRSKSVALRQRLFVLRSPSRDQKAVTSSSTFKAILPVGVLRKSNRPVSAILVTFAAFLTSGLAEQLPWCFDAPVHQSGVCELVSAPAEKPLSLIRSTARQVLGLLLSQKVNGRPDLLLNS